MPTIYTPAHINSVTFERLRSSKYTPSASLRSAAPSEREPGRAVPFNAPPGNRKVAGDFHRPYETQKFYILPFIGVHSLSHALAGVTAPSGREPGLGLYHSSGCSLKSGVTGDFHRPYETQKFYILPFIGVLAKPWGWRAIFIAPTKLRSFYISPFNVLRSLFEGGYGFCMVKMWMGFWAVIRW